MNKIIGKNHRQTGKRNRITAWILLAAAVLLIGFGVFRGEMTGVFNKAIRICLECIGLG